MVTMKLSMEALENGIIAQNYRLPAYDIQAVREKTRKSPTWLHFGAGNIFRVFPAQLVQRLLTVGLTETGIICCEGFDNELITRCYRETDNLTAAVTLHADGWVKKEIIASVTEALTLDEDMARVQEIFCAPSLQMVSFTITEKAYDIRLPTGHLVDDVRRDAENGPDKCISFLGRIGALCLARARAGCEPLALCSLDNCHGNGRRLHRALSDIMHEWLVGGFITPEEERYITVLIAYPLSMIDKITPHPAPHIAAALEADGLDGMRPFTTAKGTYTACFVNTEQPQYLIFEDLFPNGHPPLEQLGVIFSRKDIVEKAANLKGSTVLNPMDTALAVFGCLLGYDLIRKEMQDEDLVNLITLLSRGEMMRMARDPGVIDPFDYLHEALTVRYPNPNLPDTPHRIAMDTSQKLTTRFGETIRDYYNSSKPNNRISTLVYIPLVLAGWLRYLIGVDDDGKPMELSADTRMDDLQHYVKNITLGTVLREEQLYDMLSNKSIFGVNLNMVGLSGRVMEMFGEMLAGPGAVRQTLHKYCSSPK